VQAVGDEVDHLALALDAAADRQQAGGEDDASLTLEQGRPDGARRRREGVAPRRDQARRPRARPRARPARACPRAGGACAPSPAWRRRAPGPARRPPWSWRGPAVPGLDVGTLGVEQRQALQHAGPAGAVKLLRPVQYPQRSARRGAPGPPRAPPSRRGRPRGRASGRATGSGRRPPPRPGLNSSRPTRRGTGRRRFTVPRRRQLLPPLARRPHHRRAHRGRSRRGAELPDLGPPSCSVSPRARRPPLAIQPAAPRTRAGPRYGSCTTRPPAASRPRAASGRPSGPRRRRQLGVYGRVVRRLVAGG
jgi:hypothetical protein